MLIYDAQQYQTQAPGIAERFGAMSQDSTLAFRKTAVVNPGVLQKLQMNRVAPGHGVFRTREATEAWLLRPIRIKYPALPYCEKPVIGVVQPAESHLVETTDLRNENN